MMVNQPFWQSEEPFCEINYGPLLRDVLRARGWRYSTEPCHGVYDKESEKSTFYIKEFEVLWPKSKQLVG